MDDDTEMWEEIEVTESEKQMREREIRSRIHQARQKETIPAMIERYKQYRTGPSTA